MQNFLSLWLNTGAQITHGGQVQKPRQKMVYITITMHENYIKPNKSGQYQLTDLKSLICLG